MLIEMIKTYNYIEPSFYIFATNSNLEDIYSIDRLVYILIIIIVILIRTYLVTPVKVNGTSMEKTLSSNEVLILNKLDSLQREDIVVVNKDFYKTNLIKII